MKLTITLLCCFACATTFAQVGIGTTTPDESAALDVNSQSTGLLVPRMTQQQRTGIANPATGLLVIQTDGTAGFYYNAGTPESPNWLNLSAYTLQQNMNTNGKWISSDGSNDGLFLDKNGLGIGTDFNHGKLSIRQHAPQEILTAYQDHEGVSKWHTTLHAGTLNFAETNIEDYRLALKPGGNVGIGTNVPYARLGIKSTITGNLLSFNNLAGDTKWHFSMEKDNGLNLMETGVPDSRVYFQPGGRIGLGTQSPKARLHVLSAPGGNVMTFGSDISPDKWTAAMFGGSAFGFIEDVRITPHLYFQPGGNVGIGTSSPTTTLDVAGSIKYSGTLSMGIRYQAINYSLPGDNKVELTCSCPPGTAAIGGGGGHQANNNAARDIIVNFSGPVPTNSAAWRVILTNTSGDSRGVIAYAICAKVQ